MEKNYDKEEEMVWFFVKRGRAGIYIFASVGMTNGYFPFPKCSP